VLDIDVERLDEVEFPPFRAGIDAGAQLLMVGHYGLPAIIGDRTTPTSLSSVVMNDLIRGRLGFSGVIVTDALDMGAFGGADPDAPLGAGADLLLYGPRQAGALPATPPTESIRLQKLFDWLSGFEDRDLSLVGCGEHQMLATELGRRSITLVRDEAGLLPMTPGADSRILAVMPQPKDLTPADTSSSVKAGLADALRTQHRGTTELVTSFDPTDDEIAVAVSQAAHHDYVVVGTIDATPAQAQLVKSVLATGTPTVTVAMRTPYDLASYPEASTYVCTYGILPPSLDALAAALFGGPMPGRLPVAIPDLYPVRHGIGGAA
jgi:beta-N-acetylhexosaminidase